MQFIKLEINNYGLFSGLHQFELSRRGLVFIVGHNLDNPRANSNGSGKSTLFEALEFCLWGVIPKGDSIDSIINKNAGKNCWVSVTISDDDGKGIFIKRFRKLNGASGVNISVDGAEKTALDGVENQKIINNLMGLTRDIFNSCVFFPQQGLYHFCDNLSSDVECFEILTKVLQLEEIDTWAIKAKAEKQAIDSSVTENIMTISNFTSQLSVLKSIDFVNKINEYEANKKNKLTAALQLCAAKTLEADTLQVQVVDTTDLDTQVKQLENTPILSTPVPTQLININTSVGTCTNQLDTHRTKYNEILKVVEELGSSAIVRCRLCGQEITKKLAPDHISKLTAEAEVIKRESLVLKSKIDDLMAQKEQLGVVYKQQQEENKQAQLSYHKTVAGIKDKIYSNRQMLQTVGNLRKEADKLYQDCKNINQEINPFISEQERVKKEQTKVSLIIEQTEVLLREQKEEQEIYEFWIEAFSVKGLKSYILDNKLNTLTTAANEWIGLLTDNRFYIKFETQTASKVGKVRNKLNMRVFQVDKNNVVIEHAFASWSGGERTRISLGVDLGLSQLISARSKKRYNILIFDEIFKNLDQMGIVAVTEMLNKLSLTKESVFVIEHNDTMKDSFDNIITIERNNNCSRILEQK